MDKDTMSSETFSLLVWYRHDMQTDTTQLQIVRADTGEEIHLSDGSLLLRVSTNPDTPVVRCFIRHMASGREVYLQSGKRVRDFVMDCLLQKGNRPEPPDPGKAGA